MTTDIDNEWVITSDKTNDPNTTYFTIQSPKNDISDLNTKHPKRYSGQNKTRNGSPIRSINNSINSGSGSSSNKPLSIHSAPFLPKNMEQKHVPVLHRQMSGSKLTSKWSQPRQPSASSRRFASLTSTSPPPLPSLEVSVSSSSSTSASSTINISSSISPQYKYNSNSNYNKPPIDTFIERQTPPPQTTTCTTADNIIKNEKYLDNHIISEVLLTNTISTTLTPTHTPPPSTPPTQQNINSNSNGIKVDNEGLNISITENLCRTMSAEQFVKQILYSYKSAEYFAYLKENSKYPPLNQQISSSLHLCPDPCSWIQYVLMELATFFTNNKHNRYFKPKFQRILVQAICHGLQTFLDTPVDQRKAPDELNTDNQKKQPLVEEKKQDIPDLISFSDDEEDDKIEVDLIDLITDFDEIKLEPTKTSTRNQLDKNNSNSDNTPTTTNSTANSNNNDINSNSKHISILKEFDFIFDAKYNNDTASTITNYNNSDNNDNCNNDEIDNEIENNKNTSTIDNDNNEINNEIENNKNSNNKDNINSTPTISPEQLKEIQRRYSLTHEHQVEFIKMIRQIGSPSVVYYSLDVFNLPPLLTVGGEYEQEGTFLCRQLLHQEFYNEAISCIQKLQQYKNFPLATFADYMFEVGQGGLLAVYAKDKIHLQRGLLSYINIQLRYNFAGDLGIIDQAYLDDIEESKKTSPPLQRMKERKFQKELVTCSVKIIEQLGDSVTTDSYYFISLSQKYMSLRWIISSRSAQQATENDYSIEGSSNFNGLLEYVVENSDEAISKLLIKELIDIHDMTAADYFSTLLRQDNFYHYYKSLPVEKRMLGIIKGEQISYPRPPNPKKPLLSTGLYYSLPTDVDWCMVDDDASLNNMKKVLEKSKICGLDTEWVPSFAKLNPRTALMQIATDLKIIFLVDFKTLFLPSNTDLCDKAELILSHLFESKHIIKLAYEFGGDLSLLECSIPKVKNWKIETMLDLKQLRYYDTINKKLGNVVIGGLSGVVTRFLGVSVNKKQQISNWEKRPLTHEQTIYAACDSYCLLQIYQVLITQNHPFIQSTTKDLLISTTSSLSAIDNKASLNLGISNNFSLI